jgi:MtaA/CmuA family methyltransferase
MAMLAGEPVDSLPAMPIVLAFAAHHLAIPYYDYCLDYRLLSEAQVQIAQEFDLDVVTVMSDPAVEAADCGAPVIYYPDSPPANDEAHALLGDKRALERLALPDMAPGGRMANRIAAVEALAQQTGGSKIVQGWLEGPYTSAAHLRGLNALMLDLYDDPDFVARLLDYTVVTAKRFAAAQIAAGADLIGICDPTASLVGPTFYRELVWPAQKAIVDLARQAGCGVRLHICGNTRRILREMGTLGCVLIDLDAPTPMDKARRHIGPETALLGNIDPVRVLRNGTPDEITAALARCHAGSGPRYIVGAGCEVPRDTPAENLRALVAYARTHQAAPALLTTNV